MKTEQRAALLPVGFFRRPAAWVAQALLGARMVSTAGGALTSGRIVETEAYLGGVDPASHGFGFRRTARNAALFGPSGSWYVYLSYGMHWCANLVCHARGQGAAVLIRALEPLEGLEVMRARRGGVADPQLCSGPGKLCQALGITAEIDGIPMSQSVVEVLRGRRVPRSSIVVGARIGITKAADWPLRFHVARSGWVSRGRLA